MVTRRSRDADEQEKVRELLSEKGFRITEQRLLILRELLRVRTPISHPELSERLASSELDRATVYRNLLSLAEAGILVRTQLGDNVWRYELPRARGKNHGEHPHFVCTDCGTVSCLPPRSVRLAGEAIRNTVRDVQLRGVCEPCGRA